MATIQVKLSNGEIKTGPSENFGKLKQIDPGATIVKSFGQEVAGKILSPLTSLATSRYPIPNILPGIEAMQATRTAAKIPFEAIGAIGKRIKEKIPTATETATLLSSEFPATVAATGGAIVGLGRELIPSTGQETEAILGGAILGELSAKVLGKAVAKGAQDLKVSLFPMVEKTKPTRREIPLEIPKNIQMLMQQGQQKLSQISVDTLNRIRKGVNKIFFGAKDEYGKMLNKIIVGSGNPAIDIVDIHGPLMQQLEQRGTQLQTALDQQSSVAVLKFTNAIEELATKPGGAKLSDLTNLTKDANRYIYETDVLPVVKGWIKEAKDAVENKINDNLSLELQKIYSNGKVAFGQIAENNKKIGSFVNKVNSVSPLVKESLIGTEKSVLLNNTLETIKKAKNLSLLADIDIAKKYLAKSPTKKVTETTTSLVPKDARMFSGFSGLLINPKTFDIGARASGGAAQIIGRTPYLAPKFAGPFNE